MPKNNLESGINELVKESQEPTLRERWNKYLKYGMRGTNVDKWNKEMEYLDSKLPFKNKEEHDKWVQMGDVWKGDSEWLEMTDEILKRTEPNYSGEDKAGEAANKWFSHQIGGYKPSYK